jgi:hypothetical protein
MSDTQTLRHQLRAAGFCPIPLYGKEPPAYGKNNKRKGLSGWQELHEVTPEQIDLWERIWPDAHNTGALTRLMPTLDIDILDPEAAEAAEALVREHCEERGYILVRIGLPPKRAIPFRTEEPFDKIIVNLVAPNEKPEKIEFLSNGQQVVVDGIHPDTKQPYRWHGGEPGQIKLEELPYVREAEARQLVDDIVELLIKEHGYSRAPERPKKTVYNKSDVHSFPSGNGPDDWAYLIENIREGRELHDSLRDLAAKMIAAGTGAGAAINQLRALMQGSNAPHDERWQARFNDIPRLVEGAEQLREPEADASEAPAFSDEALALRFATERAADTRHVAAWSKWLRYAGTRWHTDETIGTFDTARAVCRMVAREANKASMRRTLASAKTVAAVERLARSDRRLAATAEQWDADAWTFNTGETEREEKPKP